MIHKGNKMYSVVHGVCPRCQEGKIFKYGPYRQLNFTEMNETCSHCGQSLEIEPDFYQGAMYVSYGLTTGLLMSVCIFMLLVLNMGLAASFIAIALIGVALLPVIYRLSRVIWITIFVPYAPETRLLNKQ